MGLLWGLGSLGSEGANLGARGEGEFIGCGAAGLKGFKKRGFCYHNRGNGVKQGDVIRSLLKEELPGEVARIRSQARRCYQESPGRRATRISCQRWCFAIKRYNNFRDKMIK